MNRVADTATRPRTDLGNAERLVDRHGGEIRHYPKAGVWLVWDGMLWAVDETGAVQRLAKQTVRGILEEAAAATDDRECRELTTHARRSESAAALRNMIDLASTEESVTVQTDELDAAGGCDWLLNTLSGTLDLGGDEPTIREHRRADMLTKLAPAGWRPDADAPTWNAFLDRIFAGDEEMIRYVQRCLGSSLVGALRDQAIFVLWGGGANGKSTLIEAWRSAVGDYAMHASADTFLARQNPSRGATPELARLRGARFVSAVETGEGRRLDEVLVKSMTGGDRITARPLYREEIEYQPSFKVFLATNHLPEIRGTDDGIWRRIRLIPFDVQIPEAERDGGLLEKLRAEACGILRWGVEGCMEWKRVGLNPPLAAQRRTREYRADQDTIGRFIDERCARDLNLSEDTGRLYAAYKAWASARGEDVATETAFGRDLNRRGLVKVSKRRRGGVTLRRAA